MPEGWLLDALILLSFSSCVCQPLIDVRWARVCYLFCLLFFPPTMFLLWLIPGGLGFATLDALLLVPFVAMPLHWLTPQGLGFARFSGSLFFLLLSVSVFEWSWVNQGWLHVLPLVPPPPTMPPLLLISEEWGFARCSGSLSFRLFSASLRMMPDWSWVATVSVLDPSSCCPF